MLQPKGRIADFEQVLLAFCRNFSCSRAEGFYRLCVILDITESLNEKHESEQRGDIVITCAVCADTPWWQENYGIFWEAAHWWYCGPLGLNCGA